MAPVTFHGGPLHGITVDTDGPRPDDAPDGTYRLDGASFVFVPDAELPPAGADEHDTVHVRPAAPEVVETRPRARKVTRR